MLFSRAVEWSEIQAALTRSLTMVADSIGYVNNNNTRAFIFIDGSLIKKALKCVIEI